MKVSIYLSKYISLPCLHLIDEWKLHNKINSALKEKSETRDFSNTLPHYWLDTRSFLFNQQKISMASSCLNVKYNFVYKNVRKTLSKCCFCENSLGKLATIGRKWVIFCGMLRTCNKNVSSARKKSSLGWWEVHFIIVHSVQGNGCHFLDIFRMQARLQAEHCQSANS